MRHRDKLTEYIRKEVDSIPYEEEDQMWEEFQKTNSTQLATWNKSNYFFPILLALLMVTISSVIYFQYNNTSGLTTNNNTQSLEAKTKNTQHGAIVPTVITNEMNSSNNENSIIATTENDATSTLSKNDFSLNKNLNNSTSEILKNSKHSGIKNKNSIFKKSITQESIFNNNTISSNNSTTNGSSNLSLTTDNQTINKTNSVENKGVRFSNLEVKDELRLNSKIAILSPLPSDTAELDLIPTLEYPLAILDESSIYSRQNVFFARVLFAASPNKIYTTSFDLGRIVNLTRNSGIKYNLGISVTDGYSLSQDSIYTINGLFPEEHIREKDLDYLVSSFISTEYYIKRDRLKAALGTRLSYASYSKFNGYRSSTITSFSGGTQSFGQTEYTNVWAAINRFQIEGTLNLSYRFNNLELGFSASKRLNKLIKDNIAERRKSNVPIQFGVNLSRYF